ncbi:MAG: major capsid protein, partial [Gemmatimonadales bacterium]|nr:major capsid protein [Gemmatimonadales bacterium]
GKRHIARLVSPRVPAPVRQRQAHATRAIAPAYIKEKVPFDPDDAVKRAMGEAIGGALSPQERENRGLIQETENCIKRVVRRMELMASEALRTGKLVLSGEDYPAVTVDFQRDASLSVATLLTTARWSQTTSKPLRDLKAWAKLVRKQSGVNPVHAIMGDDAFSEFADHADVKSRLDTKNIVGSELQVGQQVAEGQTYQGVIDGFKIFTYSGWYTDPTDDTTKEIWPADEVAMTAPGDEGLAGERLFGAIKDPKAGYQALPFFPKMWQTDDPAQTWLMVQSAPLVSPKRSDASMNVKVLG